MPYDAQGRWIEENEWERMMRERAAQRVQAFSRYNDVPPSLYPNQAAPYGSFPYVDPTPAIWDSSPERLRQDVPADPKYQGWDFNQEPIADTSAISDIPFVAGIVRRGPGGRKGKRVAMTSDQVAERDANRQRVADEQLKREIQRIDKIDKAASPVQSKSSASAVKRGDTSLQEADDNRRRVQAAIERHARVGGKKLPGVVALADVVGDLTRPKGEKQTGIGYLGEQLVDTLESGRQRAAEVAEIEPYTGMGDAPDLMSTGHPGMLGATGYDLSDPTGGLSAADANAAAYMAALSGDQAALLEEGGLLGGGIPSGRTFGVPTSTDLYSEAGVPMSNENLSWFGAAPVPTSPSMNVDYSQALADAGMAEVPEISIPDRYMESDKRDYETQEEADARNIEVARDRQDIMRHLDVVYGTNHSGDVTGPIYGDARQDILGNLSKEDIIDLPDWVRDIALNIHDNVTKTEILAPHIDVGTTQENIQDIINNTVGINLRDLGFDYNTALNSPNIVTKDSVLAAATLAKSGDINLSESLPEMISQVDTFKDIPAAPAKPAGPTRAELKAAAAAQRKADLARQKAAARRTRLARQALKDSQAAAARAVAASAAQAKSAQKAAKAVLSRMGNDRNRPSDREIAAAIEVMSQVDSFGSGGMRNSRGEVGMDETGYTDSSGYGVG